VTPDPSNPVAVALLRARRAAAAALDPAGGGRLSLLNLGLCAAIVASVIVAVLETEPAVHAGRADLFRGLELGFASLFALEYAVRLWVAAEHTRGMPAWRSRLRWAVSPPALVDLLALLPPLLTAAGAPSLVLRLIRLLRILRLANLGPVSRALDLVLRAVLARRHELIAALAVGGVALILAATLLHALEGEAQPEAFGSIPRALWWGVITLTTIGYGDVAPVTALGKLVASLTAVVGVGLVAAPSGILAAGFLEALRGGRER
jgi:voltage-gated potassium channel